MLPPGGWKSKGSIQKTGPASIESNYRGGGQVCAGFPLASSYTGGGGSVFDSLTAGGGDELGAKRTRNEVSDFKTSLVPKHFPTLFHPLNLNPETP